MISKPTAILAVMAAVFSGWVVSGPALGDNVASSGDIPAVFFPVKVFEFAPVIEGTNVVHDFAVFNKGKAPLLINNVRTG